MIENSKLQLGPLNIEEDHEFGGASICIGIDDFISKGFDYGDTVDISFSGGVQFKDVPFYSGYYVGYNELLLVGYQNYQYILLKYNFKKDFFDKTGISLDETVTITMNEKGKNILIQQLFEQNHSNDRNDYDSDESFCNFRPITKNNLVYRSASPCNNDYNRPYYTCRLLKKYNINYVLDLSNGKQRMKSYYMDSSINNEYWKYLYEQGRTISMPLDVNYCSEECLNTIVYMFRFMLDNEGPFLIHCSEGKDRTGFAGIVIGALANNTIDDIELDYMKTYEEYYHINSQTKLESYNAIKKLYFDKMIISLCNDKPIDSITDNDIKAYSIQYLLNGGMSFEEIAKLQSLLVFNEDNNRSN